MENVLQKWRRALAGAIEYDHAASPSLTVTETELSAPPSAIRVFFSWQSDLPTSTTRSFLLNCLKAVKKDLEGGAGPISRMEIDEATSNATGAPHIPETILKNIDAADLIVADVTTINGAAADPKRPTPNPNVVFEVGFAVGRLGWDRVVPVFNEAYGTIPDDLPFDLERRRVVQYKLSEADGPVAKDTEKTRLAGVLKRAILAIHAANPMRPIVAWEHAARRQRDVQVLEGLCSSFDLGTVEQQYIDIQRGFVSDAVLFYFEGYKGTVSSLTFQLYDTTAERLARDLLAAWEDALPDPRFTERANRGHVFKPKRLPMTKDETAESERFATVYSPFYVALKEFITHIKENYIEIDVNATSRSARIARADMLKEI